MVVDFSDRAENVEQLEFERITLDGRALIKNPTRRLIDCIEIETGHRIIAVECVIGEQNFIVGISDDPWLDASTGENEFFITSTYTNDEIHIIQSMQLT